jgi:uncharacterized protein YdeI (YjbR/CyaY-like superfamily)
MGRKDARVDAYIAKAAPFARPILLRLRRIVHRGCPGVEETMKWSFPHFDYKGMFCSMAAFRKHCAFGFWKGRLVTGEVSKEAMGQFGRIESVDDLPKDAELLRLVRKAAALNDAGIRAERAPSRPAAKKKIVVPRDLAEALKKNPKAAAVFGGFSYTNKKEYVSWITEAKTPETRKRRLETAVEWMSEGKIRNWKYERRSA